MSKPVLSKAAIMVLKNVCRKGNDVQITEFVETICKNFAREVCEVEFADAERCLVIGDENYECECPICGTWLRLDIKGLLEQEVEE